MKKNWEKILFTVVDPGFPQGEGANSPGGGAPTYDFAKFSQKLHEIERIWTPGGGGARPKFYYVDPPLVHLNRLTATNLDSQQSLWFSSSPPIQSRWISQTLLAGIHVLVPHWNSCKWHVLSTGRSKI